jgi:hypothetical protein
MSCAKLQKRSKSAHYWSNAMHFLYGCTMLEHTAMARLIQTIDEWQGNELLIKHILPVQFHKLGIALKTVSFFVSN